MHGENLPAWAQLLVASQPMNKMKSPVPIIDLFAGPGGLGEGFSAMKTNGKPNFRIGISVEKDPVAHRTLTLRSVFRQLQSTPAERHYYDYIKGEISEKQFKAIPTVAQAYDHASTEARCLELGKTDASALDTEIRTALGKADQWVLIGGPPCQAYSLAGRSRRARDATFQQDEKHFLYREYLRIIQEHQPTVFVMENVKGLLSSKHSGNPMFAKIINDLSEPRAGLQYDIRSFVVPGRGDGLDPSDYVIESELYGIPQCRHRVILLGVRKDLPDVKHKLLKRAGAPRSVHKAIGNLPKIRSRLSKADSTAGWHEALVKAPDMVRGWDTENEKTLFDCMTEAAVRASSITDAGAKFLRSRGSKADPSDPFLKWISDDQLHGVCQHDARSHMASDLARYLFAASFAKISGYSPRLGTFPLKLLPKHKSAKKKDGKVMPFQDRFRVQCRHEPATTIMSHIAKDGHYYIHYDPEQCRSLTVREAARLQTFPDNYFFEGNRTEQYTQVGNAVPPLLAFQLAEVVASLLSRLQNRS